MIIAIAIFFVGLIALTAAYYNSERESEKSKKEDNEYTEIFNNVDLILGTDALDSEKVEIAKFIFKYGQSKYIDGFNMGQEITLQVELGVPTEVAEEIMKNQYQPII